MSLIGRSGSEDQRIMIDDYLLLIHHDSLASPCFAHLRDGAHIRRRWTFARRRRRLFKVRAQRSREERGVRAQRREERRGSAERRERKSEQSSFRVWRCRRSIRSEFRFARNEADPMARRPDEEYDYLFKVVLIGDSGVGSAERRDDGAQRGWSAERRDEGALRDEGAARRGSGETRERGEEGVQRGETRERRDEGRWSAERQRGEMTHGVSERLEGEQE
ncbi:hypothetical protein Scep_012737 [Stephania cephalantha]|uniref:Uncharacterized protein n=1 Tax=Stephania cephalantha TaxID=152367 RepID=A0AAP0P7U9_9MAGN